MKTFAFILIFIAIFLGIIGLIATYAPTNPNPCFGKAKDGHYRWHSLSECHH